MRAQMTKNAVIVPAGRQGRLLPAPPPTDPAALRAEVRRQYVRYIEALLDVTDDLDDDGAVIPPTGVRVHDDDDTYLVVAADKGTATFSDTANEVAVRRGFWLGDAFASGGSAGYDHKALGITARGAWESVRRHFRELGVDPERDADHRRRHRRHERRRVRQRDAAERTLELVAAYDHRHVFLDPDPGPGARPAPSAGGCSSCRARPGTTTTASLISAGRRGLLAHGEAHPADRRDARRAGRRRRGAARPPS